LPQFVAHNRGKAMFLSKDFLDEGGPAPPQPPPGPPDRTASHRPATASGSSRGLGEEETEDLNTPTNAAMLRQKFLQQRQKTLQKQRTGGLTGMVQANQGIAMSPSSMSSPGAPKPSVSRSFSTISDGPAAPPPPPPPTGGYDGQDVPSASAISGPPDTGGSMSSPKSSDGNPLLKSVMDSMAADGEEMEGMVAPNPMTADDLKAEEARRRSSLAAALDEKGISTVFDPGAGAAVAKPQFDVSSIGPTEMKGFLLNPSPKSAGMIECRIIRDKGGLSKLFPKYILETDAGVFLMAAKKQKNNKTSKYVITMSRTDDSGKDEDAFLGKLRSNFLGLEFMAYGEGMNPKKIDSSMSQVHALQLTRQELLAVQYSSSLWGTKPRGPRKMGAVIPKVQPNGERLICRTLHPDTEGLVALQKNNNTSHIQQFHNKPPKWNEQVGAFVLNFNKRVTQASVKNFQLTTQDDPDTVFLQFGRVGKDVFNMDFRFPFSPYQAFAICLSSFDYKLCCE